LDRFPEAFQRFEEVVDVSKIKSFKELLAAFKLWAGRKWVDSPLQLAALKEEAFKREIPQIPVDIDEWRREKAEVDSLYKRVYYARRRYDYNRLRFEGWETALKRARERALAEGWTAQMLAEVEKPILRYLEASKKRMEWWGKLWEEAYMKLRREHARFRLKIPEERKIRD